MRCSSCDAENPAVARFCLECGSAFKSAETSALAPTGAASASAERRQLTCLFCDIVNSVELAERLDPEELRETLAAYHRVCLTVVRRFGGHVHDFLGDGIMVYFGFPTAHEDDVQRAIRSGLGIVEAMGRIRDGRASNLRVRIGIDTGLVVAGAVGFDEGKEGAAAFGATPNLAARLQGLAAPDSVVISSATYRLIAGYFDCRELGFRSIRGLSQPMVVHQVLNESGARTRLDVAAQRGLLPMQGRDSELGELADRWAQARAGHGGVVLVSGEPGIGKSRLIWELEQHVAQSADAYLIRLDCSPYYVNTAFYPAIQFLQNALELGPNDVVGNLDKIDGLLAQYGFDLPSMAPILATLLGVPFEDRYPQLDMPAERRRQLTIDALVRLFLIRAAHQPILVVVEDLHWADPSSFDVLTQLTERVPQTPQLVVFSFRAEFVPPWSVATQFKRLNLNRLDRDASAQIVTEIAGVPVREELLGQLMGKADGVPLYLEELTKLLIEQGAIRQGDGQVDPAHPTPVLEIPATLADSLTARLDRLSDAKGVAQLGAVIGRRFSYAVLAAVFDATAKVEPHVLRQNLVRLVEAGVLVDDRDSRGDSYTFKHALIQDAAYASLLRSTRRKYHWQIAQALTEHFPDVVEAAPELLARHYAEAGMAADSVPWWLRAGERALHASANPEAIAHLTTGLDQLAGLPADPGRDALELQFRLALGPAFIAVRGYAAPEVEASYQRARELCRELGGPGHEAPVLHGLWGHYIVRAQHTSALTLAEQVMRGAERNDEDPLLEVLQGNMEVGWSHHFLGDLQRARRHLERVLELYDHDHYGSHAFAYGDNLATSGRGALALGLWLLGYPDQALRHSLETLRTLRSWVKHPYSVAFGLDVAATLRQWRGDVADTRARAEEAHLFSEEHGLAFISGMASVFLGWVLTQEGQLDEGIAQMRRGLAAQRATGAELNRPYWLCLIVEACLQAGTVNDVPALLDDAEATALQTGERVWEAEIHRLRGQAVLSASEPATPEAVDKAEACYRRALDVARRQAARSLELRAAMALSRLWQARGRESQAHELLAPVYAWFTEGFDTPDLREASELLTRLDVSDLQQLHPTLLSGGG